MIFKKSFLILISVITATAVVRAEPRMITVEELPDLIGQLPEEWRPAGTFFCECVAAMDAAGCGPEGLEREDHSATLQFDERTCLWRNATKQWFFDTDMSEPHSVARPIYGFCKTIGYACNDVPPMILISDASCRAAYDCDKDVLILDPDFMIISGAEMTVAHELAHREHRLISRHLCTVPLLWHIWGCYDERFADRRAIEIISKHCDPTTACRIFLNAADSRAALFKKPCDADIARRLACAWDNRRSLKERLSAIIGLLKYTRLGNMVVETHPLPGDREKQLRQAAALVMQKYL